MHFPQKTCTADFFKSICICRHGVILMAFHNVEQKNFFFNITLKKWGEKMLWSVLSSAINYISFIVNNFKPAKKQELEFFPHHKILYHVINEMCMTFHSNNSVSDSIYAWKVCSKPQAFKA